MASISSTSESNLLKVLYPSGPEYELPPDCSLWSYLTKKTDWEGDSVQTNPIVAPMNGSHGFPDAQEGKSTPSHYKFNVTEKNAYVIGSIENKLIKRASSKRGAIVEVLKNAAKLALEAWDVMMRRDIWQNYGGARGRVGSGQTGTTVTLLDIRDVVHFHVGMVLQASTADGTSGSLKAGSVTLTGIDRVDGTLTVSGNWDAAGNIPAIAANDYLFRKGDFGVAFNGVLDWIPTSDPSATTFFGVDRTADITNLSGIRYAAGANGDIEGILMDGAALGHRLGARGCDSVFLNSLRWADLAKALQSKSRYFPSEVKDGKGKIGWKSFTVMGPMGPMDVLPDPYCPYGYALITNRNAWEFKSIGDFPHWEKAGGDQYFVEASADAREFRLKGYGNLICHRPVDNILCTL